MSSERLPDGMPASPAEQADGPSELDSVPLLELREPLPPVVDTRPALDDTLAALAAGTGPVAVDAERASGYRYSQRAYLVQLRRAGSGTALVDPTAFDGLADLGAALADSEWILHAASQDLPCLLELGMRPRRLFDTELAGRLLDLPRVGLASMVEELLGYRLRKEHSAVDWSTRPLPLPWLEYAALDVEALVELRKVIGERLAEEGKLGWAEQEFAALSVRPPSEPRPDPWRRTSGIHRVRGRRNLGVVRALWQARDAIASERDVTPGRVLSDAAIIEAASSMPRTRKALASLASFRSRGAQRHVARFADALQTARELPETELPLATARYTGPPPAKAWADKDPAAAARLVAARAAVGAVADEHRLPGENLLAPDSVRRLCWSPPERVDTDSIAQVLRGLGAREWQVGLTAQPLADALAE
ncbi:MAG TPA: HRDC domain-containing protein [Nocardioidaceae bacterium]|nr:HRDC domain-containing protein [Nocardioidaceae bacterium]